MTPARFLLPTFVFHLAAGGGENDILLALSLAFGVWLLSLCVKPVVLRVFEPIGLGTSILYGLLLLWTTLIGETGHVFLLFALLPFFSRVEIEPRLLKGGMLLLGTTAFLLSLIRLNPLMFCASSLILGSAFYRKNSSLDRAALLGLMAIFVLARQFVFPDVPVLLLLSASILILLFLLGNRPGSRVMLLCALALFSTLNFVLNNEHFQVVPAFAGVFLLFLASRSRNDSVFCCRGVTATLCLLFSVLPEAGMNEYLLCALAAGVDVAMPAESGSQ